jgi:hypothetical protein
VAFLPEELAGTEERLCLSHDEQVVVQREEIEHTRILELPSDDAVPLIEL